MNCLLLGIAPRADKFSVVGRVFTKIDPCSGSSNWFQFVTYLYMYTLHSLTCVFWWLLALKVEFVTLISFNNSQANMTVLWFSPKEPVHSLTHCWSDVCSTNSLLSQQQARFCLMQGKTKSRTLKAKFRQPCRLSPSWL